MEKKINTKTLLLIISLFMIITLSIAFASIAVRLKIEGTGKVDPANWDIHFINLSEPEINGGATVTGTPTLSNKGASITNLNVNLKLPGDSVTWTVDIENTGDINAEISDIEKTELTDKQSELFEFSVYYTDTEENLKIGDELQPSDRKKVTIKIKYKDIEDPDLLPSEVQTINLSYKITYEQSKKEMVEATYESGLPKTYTPVEYLESTGTQYIDTEYKFSGGTAELDISFAMLEVSPALWSAKHVCGQMNNSNPANRFLDVGIIHTSKNTYLRTTSGNTLLDNGLIIDETPTIGEIERISLQLNEDTKTLTLNNNGETKNMTYSGTAINSGNYMLFGISNGDNDVLKSFSRIYTISITDNGTLVRNFIPALDPNGRPCMYDTVSKQPFYNQGTGEFLYFDSNSIYATGLPKTYTPVEYLESTGTQYIDTGIGNINQDTSVEFTYETSSYTSFSGLKFVCGARDNVGSYGYPAYNFIFDSRYNKIYSTYGTIENDKQYINLTNGKHTISTNKNLIYVDGVLKVTYTYTNFSVTNSMLIFTGRHWQGGVPDSRTSAVKLYLYKIWDNNTLLGNFIPALDPNGRPCMYDTVSKTAFYNQGTGEFLYSTE